MSNYYWVIANCVEGEWEYWSNSWGWGSFDEATRFTEAERNVFHLLPCGGEWQRVEKMIPTETQASSQMIAAAPQLYEALRKLVNYNNADPDLYVGDDDGVLGRIMYEAQVALGAATRREA